MPTGQRCCTLLGGLQKGRQVMLQLQSPKKTPKPQTTINFQFRKLKEKKSKHSIRLENGTQILFQVLCVSSFSSIYSTSCVHDDTPPRCTSVPQHPRPEAKDILFSLHFPDEQLIVCLEVGREKLAQSTRPSRGAGELQTQSKGCVSHGKDGRS